LIINAFILVVKMQLYALEGACTVPASSARKGKTYSCLECRQPVQLKKGMRRQPHFYHIRRKPLCRQHRKSLAHLLLQLHLKCLISGISLEKPFPSIGRIADAVWEDERIVFEIQCSPISRDEALGRISDYTSIGYQTVWILHEGKFGGRILTPAELELRKGTCYYAKKTFIYDQFEVIRGNKRVFKGPPLPVEIYKPLKSAEGSRFAFQGDLTDRLSKETDISHLRKLEKRWLRPPLKWRFLRLYRLFVEKLLEISAPE